jgi:mRNA-degrading endonuclease toxin of MazEF toxin-antitoxin module
VTGDKLELTPADFDDWNEKKKIIHVTARLPLFREGQVWWCGLGVNVGPEVYGKGPWRTRPVIVLRKINHQMAVVVPVTTAISTGPADWYHPMRWAERDQLAMLHQVRSVSATRFQSRMVELPESEFQALRTAFQAFLDF